MHVSLTSHDQIGEYYNLLKSFTLLDSFRHLQNIKKIAQPVQLGFFIATIYRDLGVTQGMLSEGLKVGAYLLIAKSDLIMTDYKSTTCKKCGKEMKEVFARSVTRNGRLILPKKGEFLHFYVCETCKK